MSMNKTIKAILFLLVACGLALAQSSGGNRGGGGLPSGCSSSGSGNITCSTFTAAQYKGSVQQTCDASTVPDYGQAVCVKTLDTATLLSFDGTSATAIQAIAAPASGKRIKPYLVDGTLNYLAGSQVFSSASVGIRIGYGVAYEIPAPRRT